MTYFNSLKVASVHESSRQGRLALTKPSDGRNDVEIKACLDPFVNCSTICYRDVVLNLRIHS